MPFASDIAIVIAGNDVTNRVIFSSARFESQTGAIPGTAEALLKDDDQSLDFTTGDEWTVEIDGVRLWGGFVMTAARVFALPVVDTTVPADVKARQWRLTGIDYNILFDKRVIHNAADHFQHLPYFALDRTMGDLLRNELFANYLDISGDGLDTSSLVDNLWVPRFDASGNPDPDASKQGAWPQQGSYWRSAMDQFAQFGAVYYINADKKIVFTDAESTVAAWGFSDVPNKLALPTAGATYGMREFEEIDDASAMANDAFVWGGSEWAGTGGTVFARKQNSASITAHNRWQYAETRFGELRDQGEVTARANVISSGTTTGSVGGDTARGLAVDQQQIRVAWFGHDVPLLSGSPAHLRSSDVVTFVMNVMTENGIDPAVFTLPLRTVKITFPTLPASGSSPSVPKTYVRFDGFFGVQMSDPWWLWKFLRELNPTIRTRVVATADASTTAAIYGTLGSFPTLEAADSVRTVFTIPFAYIDGSTEVYVNRAFQIPGVDYSESSPGIGQITFASPPTSGQTPWVVCRIAGGYA